MRLDGGMTDAEMMTCEAAEMQWTRLRAIMRRLRGPGGCPWDAEQTHESIRANLLEEAYEVIDAIDRGNDEDLCEELGDYLLQVVFHAELAEERGAFDVDEVARVISEKLIRRHPHVFGESNAGDSEAVLKQWDAIKRAEKGAVEEGKSRLAGVGDGLPAMLAAVKIQKTAAKAGFSWREAGEYVAKIREELGEFERASVEKNEAAVAEELGDLLFAVVNLARGQKLNPELLLHEANQKFKHRFAKMEQALGEGGEALEDAGVERLLAAWNAAK